MTSTDATTTAPPRRTTTGAPWGGRRSLFGVLNTLPTWTAVLVVVAGFLAAWQAVVSFTGISPLVLPSPWAVFLDLIEVTRQLFSGGFLLEQLWITVQEVFIGFLLAAVVGISVGTIVGQSEFGRKGIMPLFVLLDSSPKIAFTPVFIAWFGFGITSKFLMAAFMSVFPIIVGTAAGLAATSDQELKLFRSMKATPWDTFWKLKVFRALPFAFTGFKIAVVSSVTGAVAAEFIGGGRGFGEQVRTAAAQLSLDRVFALIIYLSVLGLSLYLVVAWLQKRLIFWERHQKK